MKTEGRAGTVFRNGPPCVEIPMSRQSRVLALLEQLRDTTASVFFVPDVAELIQGRLTRVAGLPMVLVCDTPLQGDAATIKRVFDLIVTVTALPFLLPVPTPPAEELSL